MVFSMRSKIELVNHAKMAHQLTLANNPDLHNPFFGVLAVELVDCLYRFLLKRVRPELEYGKIEHLGIMFWLDGGNGRIFAPNKIDYLDLENLREWSQTLIDNVISEHDGGGVRFDASKYPESYMKFFYISNESRVRPFNIGLPEEYILFVEAYRKTLDVIAPLE